jgi:hypothetical protein
LAGDIGLDLLQRGIIALLQNIAPHHLALGAVKFRDVPSPMGLGRQAAGLTTLAQKFLDERAPDPEQLRYFLLCPSLLVYGLYHSRAEV